MRSLLLSVVEAATLTGAAVRTVRLHAASGRYAATRMPGMGGSEYRIDLDSLPAEAQARYWRERIKAPTAAEERARLEALNLDEQTARLVAREAGIQRREERAEALPLNADEWRARRERWEALPQSMREEAERRAQAVRRLDALLKDGRPKMAAFAAAAAECSESTSTLRRWQQKTRNQHPADWPLMLVPDYACKGAPEADLHPAAWAYIKTEWLVQSKPTLTAVCRRAQREGNRRGWGALPSIKTIKRRIDREIPQTEMVLLREGPTALERMYPAQQRDYSTLAVHALWCSDGRKADLFVTCPEGGKPYRPILMVWIDVRTRKPLGWSVGKTENVPLVRASLRDAMTRSQAVPREFLLDNGRAYASKEITGGQPNRYRFKIKDDDMQGVATLLGIGVVWATPHHGQSKPIESFWRTLSETDKRAEFAGAYCGNSPDAKPEEFDAKKAVPLARYLAAVKEDLAAYMERSHRGDSMNGASPEEVYDTLMSAAVVRRPTAEQLRFCLLAAENKMLHALDRSITLFGGCRYWSEALHKLPSRGPYTVRYDADDAATPVALYDGDRFLCEVPLIDKAGFRDQQAARDHQRAQRAFYKTQKDGASALLAQAQAARWIDGGSLTPITPQAGEAPGVSAKVPELVALKRNGPKRKPDHQAAEDGATAARLADPYREAKARRAREEAEEQEAWGRRAAGAR